MNSKRIGQILSIDKGKKYTLSEDVSSQSMRIIGIEDLRNDENLKFTDEKQGILAEESDILIAWDGANAGTIGYGKKGLIGSTIARLRLHNPEEYNTAFIGKFLQSKFDYLKNTATGATIPHVNRAALEELKIPVIGINDQIRIADILSRTESLIAKRKESIRLLDDLVKSVFMDMFGDPVRNEKGFVKLDKYINFLTSGSRGWAQYYSTEGALFLRIQNVGYAELRLKDIIKVNVPDSAEGRRTRVQQGDLLLSITADLGRTAVIPKDFEEAYINQHLALIRLNSELNPLFVAYYFSIESGQAQIQRFNRVGVKSGLNFQNIRDLEFPYFDISKQSKFASVVEKVEATKVKYRESLSELEALCGSLSQRAFRGEL